MTWPGLVATYLSFDPMTFVVLFLMGSNLLAGLLGLLVLYIKHGAPKLISDLLYPIASKTGFTLLLLVIFSYILPLLYVNF